MIYIYLYDRKRILEVTSETSGCRCERPQSELFQSNIWSLFIRFFTTHIILHCTSCCADIEILMTSHGHGRVALVFGKSHGHSNDQPSWGFPPCWWLKYDLNMILIWTEILKHRYFGLYPYTEWWLKSIDTLLWDDLNMIPSQRWISVYMSQTNPLLVDLGRPAVGSEEASGLRINASGAVRGTVAWIKKVEGFDQNMGIH